jgi:hypothetical protein
MTEGGLSGGRTHGKLTSIVGRFRRKLKLRRSCGPLKVKTRNAQIEHFSSGMPRKADIRAGRNGADKIMPRSSKPIRAVTAAPASAFSF